jgi:hypothetical protein
MVGLVKNILRRRILPVQKYCLPARSFFTQRLSRTERTALNVSTRVGYTMGKSRKIRPCIYSVRSISETSHQAVLKCCGKNPLLHDNCMLNLPSFVRRSAIITAICVVLVLTKRESLAQAPYDAPARTALANEINQTYGTLVTPSLSITELFDIKNRLDKADSIAQNYGVDLDYREHSFIELCDIESRIRLSIAINQQYGKNIDWREHGYTQLLEMEKQLNSQASVATH